MEKTSKKPLIILAAIFVGVIVFVAAILIGVTQNTGSVKLEDSGGEVFATVEWDGTQEVYITEDEAVRAYAQTVMDEAYKVYKKQNKLSEDELKKNFFKGVTNIKTNLDRAILGCLSGAYNEQEFKDIPCEMAVTDLNGRLVAFFSSGNNTGEYLATKNYAGSAIKPLSVYAPAIGSGKFNWSSMVMDSPVSKVQDVSGEWTDWPVNSTNEYTYKNITVAKALVDSTNTVAVRMLKKTGVKKAMDVLEKNYNIDITYEKLKVQKTNETEVLGNIALGYLYNGVTVIDMAGSFQVFANGGKYTEPVAVDEILSDGEVLYKTEYHSKNVMTLETSEILNKMMQKAVGVGTGKDALVKDTEVGGKTGTTTGNEDNWFVGFTPDYCCAVWHSVYLSENIADKIFADVFKNIEPKNQRFPHSKNVVSGYYCNESGKLKSDTCRSGSIGYYTENNMPGICTECSR